MKRNGAGREGVRVDLHLHSRASGMASNWWVKGLGTDVEARESYTPPERAYRMAKEAGMDFVTLTDHETVEGALSVTGHPDFFVGEEVSARFPEDGNHADVLVYGLDERVHREAQARRDDIYELVAYLREEETVHVLAHPVYAMPGPLGRDQMEKRLVLFGLWEFVNGSRPEKQNRLARELAETVGPIELRQMAMRQGLGIPEHRSISGTAGSDDHGGIYGGATHTVAPPGIRSPGEFLEALAEGEVQPAGEDGSVEKLVHTGFRLAAAAIEEDDEGQAVRVVRRFALRPALLRRLRGASPEPEAKILKHVPLLARLGGPEVKKVLMSRYEKHLSDSLGNVGSGLPALDFFSSIGSFMDGHTYIAPYVALHGYFGREGRKASLLRREVLPGGRENLKVGVFVDGMEAVHGVATMYRNVQLLAERKHAGAIEVVRCGVGSGPDATSSSDGGTSLRAVATLPVPLYDGLTLGVPSLLDVIEHAAAEDYDALHVATPGPLGLAALVAGLVLGIPVVGAYHTEFGAYAGALSGDAFVAEIVEVAVREFYERCSVVAVPSQATALALRNRGYRIGRFEVLKNGVDAELFNPGKKDFALHDTLGGGRKLLLYAGRVSKEKGLEKLASGYLDLLRRRDRDDVRLVIAGDGPYRAKLEATLGESATFTGFLSGEGLARLFASCDVFVFPSTTDTLGRAVAEAQASGLPAVVCGSGGPRECIQPGTSGFVVSADENEEFFSRIEHLLDDDTLRERMGLTARDFAGSLSWEAAFDRMLDLHYKLAGNKPDLAASL